MEITSLKVKKREQIGKATSRRLRITGFIPGVFYGKGENSVPLVLYKKDLQGILQKNPSEHPIIQIEFEGENEMPHVLLKDIQHDPVTGEALHVDFQHIDMTRKIKVKVEIALTGKSKGVAENGGVLNFISRELEIECLPSALPENLKVDITSLDINDSIHIRDLKIDEGIRILGDPDAPIVSVTAPHVEAEVKAEVPAEEAAAAAEAPKEGETEAKAAPKGAPAPKAAPAEQKEKAPKGKGDAKSSS